VFGEVLLYMEGICRGAEKVEARLLLAFCIDTSDLN
jgi:hypothetical protein